LPDGADAVRFGAFTVAALPVPADPIDPADSSTMVLPVIVPKLPAVVSMPVPDAFRKNVSPAAEPTDDVCTETPLAAAELSVTYDDPLFAVTVSDGVSTANVLLQLVPIDADVDVSETLLAVRVPAPVMLSLADRMIELTVPDEFVISLATEIAAFGALTENTPVLAAAVLLKLLHVEHVCSVTVGLVPVE
jgi:hypothetical protein